MSLGRILLVEDEADQRELVARLLRRAGYELRECDSAEAALAQASAVELVISDWKLGGALDGMALLFALQERELRPAFIMVTAYGTVAHAMEAVRAGADDYLEKPFERARLLLAVERTLRARRLQDENQRLTEDLTERDRLVDLIGRAPTMLSLFRSVEKVARTQATALITGESGTGKELAARALHSLSERSRGPFVPVNCAAIPETLLEAELFGVEKGAYSGADKARSGKFQAADGGTLFLDEIGELPLPMQSKLLRAIQEKVVTPIGSTKSQQIDLRFVAATNRELEAEVRAGRFRDDLYYRLNVISLHMPALRDRREDISRLIHHFVERAVREHNVPKPRFSSPLTRALLDHPWPGNVRQLANTIERLVVLAEKGEARIDDLPPGFLEPATSSTSFQLPPTGMNWELHERDVLKQALQQTRGNRSKAAKMLALPYKAFLYRLEKHGLSEGPTEH